jgi:phosphohistidine swiveling domain-containing protein
MMEPGSIEVVSGMQVTIDKETGEVYGADYLGE